MRILSFVFGLMVSFALCATASASTFNFFTYTYTQAGNNPITVIDTFSMPAELPASSSSSDKNGTLYRYDNVVLNDDPSQVVAIEFFDGPYHTFSIKAGVGNTTFTLLNEVLHPFFSDTSTYPVFAPGVVNFISELNIGSSSLPLSNASLLIAQETIPDPVYVTLPAPYSPTGGVAAAVTPEPSSVALLGTGLLCIAATIRKRLAQ